LSTQAVADKVLSLQKPPETITPNVQFPSKFNTIFEPMRYKCYYGGRGSGKSVSVAQALIMLALRSKIRILCCREIQKSIQESVLKIIADKIEVMGLLSEFEIQKKTITCKNGSDFIFDGLKNNVTSIKSLEGVDYVWVEEAEAVTEESWDILIPTIRKANSEIWITFNPFDEQDPTYQMFVMNPPENCMTVKVNYMDNPFFPEVFEDRNGADEGGEL